jgi:hypothetical protein
MVQNIHGRGVDATRLLDQDDDVPALFWVDGIGEADQMRLARWRFVAAAEGRTPNFQGVMKESYSNINLMLKTLLRATKKLWFAKLDRELWT